MVSLVGDVLPLMKLYRDADGGGKVPHDTKDSRGREDLHHGFRQDRHHHQVWHGPDSSVARLLMKYIGLRMVKY